MPNVRLHKIQYMPRLTDFFQRMTYATVFPAAIHITFFNKRRDNKSKQLFPLENTHLTIKN